MAEEAESWQGQPPTPSFPVASRLCPPFLVFSSIWRGCSHHPRWGLQLERNAICRSPGRRRATRSNSAAARGLRRGPSPLRASVSPAAVGWHHTPRGPGAGPGTGHKPGPRVGSERAGGTAPSPQRARENSGTGLMAGATPRSRAAGRRRAGPPLLPAGSAPAARDFSPTPCSPAPASREDAGGQFPRKRK